MLYIFNVPLNVICNTLFAGIHEFYHSTTDYTAMTTVSAQWQGCHCTAPGVLIVAT